jgi:Flp pilus assembly protein TadG
MALGGLPRPPRPPRGEQGQSLVEFTVVLVPLLLLLFGIIELGVVMYDKVTVVQDAREAVRLASVNDPSGHTILSDAPAGSTLTFSCSTDPNSGNAQGAYNVGDKVTAHVTYVHNFVTPLIGDLFGGSIDLSSNATMTLEGQPTSYC